MTNLDVLLRLKMANQLGAGAKAAEKDLKGVKDAAQAIGKGGAADRLGRDLAKAGGTAKVAKRDIIDLRREGDRLGSNRAGAKMAADLEKVGRAARAARRDVDALGRRTAAGRTGRPEVHPGGGTAGAGVGAAALALGRRVALPLGAGYGAKKALDSAVDFEAGMAEVKKKVDVTGPADLAVLETMIRKMAMDLGIARTEMAGLTAEAGASGIVLADLPNFMKLTGKAAIGWDMLPREASQALAEIKSGLRLTIPQMEALSDKINALGDNSAAKERDIVEMFQRSGAAAKAAGIDIDTSLAFLTGAKAIGIQAEIGARWWGNFSSKFQAGFKGKKSAEALKMLGLDEKTLAKGVASRPFETIMDFMERLERSGDKKVKIAKNLFGDEWFDETLRVLQGLGEIRKQRDMLRDPGNWRGSLEKGLQIQLATTKNHMERLKVLSSEVGDRLSRWALPPINTGIEWLITKFDALTAKSSTFSKNMAWLEGRFPEWFGKGEAKASEKEPNNNPWAGIAGDRMARANALEAEADQATKEADLLSDKKKADREKKKALEAQAETLKRMARGERAAGGMAAARDMSGMEEGAAMAAGIRAKRSADDRAWADQVERLKEERMWAKEDLKSWLPRTQRAQGQANRTYARADEAFAGHLGVKDTARAAKAMDILAGLVEQSRLAKAGGRGNQAGLARKNFERLKGELKDTLGGEELEPALRAALERYIGTLGNEGDKAVEMARKIAAELLQTLSINAHPTITPQVAPSGGGGAPSSAPAKTGGVGKSVINQYINSNDPGRAARLARREQEKAVRSARAGSLHDIGSWA